MTRVKSKVLFGLTKRQLLCFGAAALIGVPSFFLLRQTGNTSLATMCMVIIMLPLFLLAMYERDGQPLEVVARHFINARFQRPVVRPYKTDNYYAALMRQYEVYEEVEAIVRRNKDAAPDEKGAEAGTESCGRGKA